MNPLEMFTFVVRRITRSTTSAAAGALGIALVAVPCHAESAAKQPSRSQDAEIRPFRVDIPQAELDDLRRRLLTTRWPDKETVPDQSQGVQLARLQGLVRYWATEYDWRKGEAKLNAYPQFKTTIDGLEIHFIHVRSRHAKALPLIVTHGWPGSVFEQVKLIEPLTDPTRFGGRAEDAFHVVIPSLPGFGFSGRPTEPGWGLERIGDAWAVLMKRLGYTRYVAQGGDWGAGVVNAMARQAPVGLIGIHSNLPAVITNDVGAALAGSEPALSALSDNERSAVYDLRAFVGSGGLSYLVMMGARPQAVGYSLTDSPAGLAAWMLVHGGVCDNGRGIPEDVTVKGKEGHFGLRGMRERAAHIGATLKVHSPADGNGTRVELVVPERALSRK